MSSFDFANFDEVSLQMFVETFTISVMFFLSTHCYPLLHLGLTNHGVVDWLLKLFLVLFDWFLSISFG